MNESSQGYYSLVQCCPDLARMESINVGVILFAPTKDFLDARMTSNSRRARKLFSPDVISGSDFAAQLGNLSARVRQEANSRSIVDASAFQEFAAKRANGLQLTPPRGIRVGDPAADLDDLFRELVDAQHRTAPRGQFERRVRERLQPLADSRKLQFDVTLEVPVIGGAKRFDAGFQNGAFHLIETVAFDSEDKRRNVQKAGTAAVEGLALSSHHSRFGDTKLIVIGSFDDDRSSKDRVEAILREHRIRLFTEDELGQLVREIERNGKLIA